jgi:[ribosomal protein S5]-alanine N-acetyltransferase
MTDMISTDRFTLRQLTKGDVTSRYLSWLTSENTRDNIEYAKEKHTLSELMEYVVTKQNDQAVLFLGIFSKTTFAHIGNIKLEPIDDKSKTAILGIMIGDPEWRGKGVALEVIVGAGKWLNKTRRIQTIVLGVSLNNTAAIRVYEKAGFAREYTPFIPNTNPLSITMAWHL